MTFGKAAGYSIVETFYGPAVSGADPVGSRPASPKCSSACWLTQRRGSGDRACRRSQGRWPLRGASTSVESPSRRRASPRCWSRNVRRAPDDERRDAVRRGGRRPHDPVRGAAGNVAHPSNGEVARPASRSTAAPQRATGHRARAFRRRRAGEKNSYSPGDVLHLGLGGARHGSHPGASRSGTEGGHPYFFACLWRKFHIKRLRTDRCGVGHSGGMRCGGT
jgi:hypothetical protein